MGANWGTMKGAAACSYLASEGLGLFFSLNFYFAMGCMPVLNTIHNLQGVMLDKGLTCDHLCKSHAF